MKKEFTANILFLLAINLLIKPFYSLVIDTSVQNTIGPNEYGLYLALFNFIYIQQIFADLGLQNYNNRNIAQNPQLLPSLLPKVLGSKIIFTIFFAGAVLLTAWVFDYSQHLKEILIWIIGTQACLSFLLYCRTNISGIGKYYVDSIFSVVDKLILILWLIYILWLKPPADGFQLVHFVQAQFFSMLIALIACLTYTHLKINKLSLSLDFKFTKALLIKSLPYATLVLLMAGYSRMDGIMLEQLLQDEAFQAGKYASSYRLYDTYNNFAFLFAVLLLPMFSRMIASKENVQELVTWAFGLLSLGSLFLISIGYFFGLEILDFIYDREIDSDYTQSLIYLFIASLPLSLNYIFGTLLTANGNLKLLNVIALGGFAVNLILNLWMIPMDGAPGAALATLVTQGLVLLLQMFFSYRYFKLKRDYIQWSKLLLSAGFIMCLYYVLSEQLSMQFWQAILVGVVMYLIMAFLLKLISLKDLRIMSQ